MLDPSQESEVTMTGTVDTFLVQRMGAEEGPFTAAELQQQARVGTLRAATLVKRGEGTGNWFPAAEIPGVFSDKDWLTAVLLSFFLGVLGIDRFYLGYTVYGILKLITVGGCGIWYIVDLILIAMGRMTDAKGLPLRRN
jgi:hypothetical protein